ncbi:polysaccharide lyase family protein [Haloferula sp. BvORR071]|uniref:polysaccharide lyase family protein n=1 Tax=Haloferula sp. BvORR071 TaxID=1396141 RepID=UPI002240FD0D|nr:polysaccharide lyase family protein [Haloferula sp. BvORR071]
MKPSFKIAATVLAAGLSFSSVHAEVHVRDEGRTFVLENGKVSARIDKAKATLISFKRGDLELIRGGTGYWSFSGGGERGTAIDGFAKAAESRITLPGGSTGEIAIDCRYDPAAPGAWPVNVSFRYALTDDTQGLYIYGIYEHPAEFPGFGIGEARYVVKPDPQVFDYLTVDAERSRKMPTGEDWDEGTEMNLKEARRLNTGIHKGEVEHKYGYSALFSESPAYGWSSSSKKVGLWMVNPSLEYIAGGPTKPELTGHLDVNRGGRPVLLNMWHGSHYGGTSLEVKKGEAWSMVVGPFLLQTNEGPDAMTMWKDAMKTATAEIKRWPYPWVDSPLYAAKQRVPVTGKITVKDPVGNAKPGAMWVGLTAADYQTGSRRWTEKVGWQRDGKHYHYWAKAATDGSFRIGSVRPGQYVLHAFADGVLGEFSREAVTVEEGKPLALGNLAWSIERAGPTVWEIGVPDRSASEFRNGDRYWLWGHYLDFRKEFPNGVDFTIGKSDWKKDWNLCQPLTLDDNGHVTGDSVWKVHFDLKEMGEHRLRIALCGHRENDRLTVAVNGRVVGDSGRLPENGVMHRDGYRGLLTELDFPIPADALRTKDNVLELRLSGQVWHQGLLYDYLRLERIDPKRTSGT